MPHLLFVNKSSSLVDLDARLELRMQPVHKERRVLWPTEPWESWAVFAYNHVVAGDEASGRLHRLYYDCIEGAGVPPGLQDTISHRRICLAESKDGLSWTKPELGIYNRSGSTRNNILVEDSGVSVFIDGNPATPADARWKMLCSNAAYASPDGLRWRKLPFRPIAMDDTKPTGYYDPAVGKYVISVRRDLPPFDRTIGRCVTSNISDWQAAVPGHAGCDVVFRVDERDPQPLDVYTNAWTPYPSIDAPLVHLFFPSMYMHFGAAAPFGLGNDGLLDIRLVVSLDGAQLGYTDASNARAPFVGLGTSTCGGSAHAPAVPGGWCAPDSKSLSTTSFDTSAVYMASGYVPSDDGSELFFYASGQPFTHGGDGRNQTWANNTGIRLLRVRRDGFVAVEAPYDFSEPLPTLTTVEVKVPSDCAAPTVLPGPVKSACAYDYPGRACPAALPAVACESDADCGAHGSFTCHGDPVRCLARNGSKVCASGGDDGDVLCLGNTSRLVGGVELRANVETSVVGFVAIEVLRGGRALDRFKRADRLKGSAINAVASWDDGTTASISALAGSLVSLRVTMADSKLYSLRLACSSDPSRRLSFRSAKDAFIDS